MAEVSVDDLDYDEAAVWLEKNDIPYEHLESLEEMIQLIKQHLHGNQGDTSDADTGVSRAPTTSQMHSVMNSQNMMRDILARDLRMKTSLSELYQDLIMFVQLEQVDDGIRDVMAKMYGDFTETLVSHMSELVNDECPIVVAGETSAGKSSLLNLLLGTDVLPHSLLCATATVCRLHNSDKKMFQIEEEIIEIHDGETSDSLRERLRKYVSSEDCRQEHKYKQVDIYWPIPMLQDRVTIVDTPGIGESDEITKRLMNYLPNAVAFIYVINSAIAGGVQDDRLLHILNEQHRWETEGRLCGFDRSCTIFVCNKWDQVEVEREENAVMADTLKKLRKVLPDLNEHQVFKMSTTKAARYIKSGMGHTEEFQTLLDGIKRLVPASLEAKVRLHYRWLEKFMTKLQVTISSRINHAHATEDEKRKLQDAVLHRLNMLSMDSDRVKANLIQEADAECNKIVDSLYDYLQQTDVHERILAWRDSEAPNMGSSDLEVTKFNADKIIMSRINGEILAWEQSSHMIKDLSEKLTLKFYDECALLGQTCSEIDLVIDNSSSGFREICKHETTGSGSDRKLPIFSASEKAVLVVAAPLWLPLVTAASLLFLPVGIGMLIKESIKGVQQKKKYTENKAAYMTKWTELLLMAICKRETIKVFVFGTYFAEFERKLQKVCDEFIPNQIAADQKQVHIITNDRRQSKEILEQYRPLQRGLKSVFSKFLYFRLRFISEDLIPLRNIKKVRNIGKGSFSDVFLATWQNGETMKKVALKEMRKTLTGENIYSQLMEVECQRKLKHPNIVAFYGVAYASQYEENPQESDGQKVDDSDTQTTHVNDSDNAPEASMDGLPSIQSMSSGGGTLLLLLELCEKSLENLVFNDSRLQCRTYNSITSRYKTFQFYITMATGICDAVAYIHANNYLHRDLKLSNVLVKNGTARVCDLGFARMESAHTNTYVGTSSHMAPELIDHKPYNFAVDIYSIGILLWELWYGKHAYSEHLYRGFSDPALFDMIRSGTRPMMDGQASEYKFQPMDELKQIMRDCWSMVPSERPVATSVRDKLKQVYDKHYRDCDRANCVDSVSPTDVRH